MGKGIGCGLALILALVPGAGHGQVSESASDAAFDCATRGVPEPDSVRAVRISSRDRTGSEQKSVARLYSRLEQGQREVRIEFVAPPNLAGTAVILLERPDATQMWLSSPELGAARQVHHAGRTGAILGSDFSFEDVEHLLAFRRPSRSERLEDRRVEGRDVYQLEITPGAGSAYDRVVSMVDKKTCIALRTELYENGRKRKQLLVNPVILHKRGPTWLPQIALMEDLDNMSSTVIMVDTTEQSDALGDELFAVSAPGPSPVASPPQTEDAEGASSD